MHRHHLPSSGRKEKPQRCLTLASILKGKQRRRRAILTAAVELSTCYLNKSFATGRDADDAATCVIAQSARASCRRLLNGDNGVNGERRACVCAQGRSSDEMKRGQTLTLRRSLVFAVAASGKGKDPRRFIFQQMRCVSSMRLHADAAAP